MILINKDEITQLLCGEVCGNQCGDYWGKCQYKEIRDADEAVIHCRDCRYNVPTYSNGGRRCDKGNHKSGFNPDWFCADGESGRPFTNIR